MRISPFAAAAGFLSLAAAFPHKHQSPTRKTISYGPIHPYASFITTPQNIVGKPYLGGSRKPLDIARRFLDGTLLRQTTSPTSGYAIRDDSYTDKNTGITHVYVHQVINNVEVINGNINLNIRDGQVLSYGDSFYRGDTPTLIEDGEDKSHMEYCRHLYGGFEDRLVVLRSFCEVGKFGAKEPSFLRNMPQLLRAFDHFSEMDRVHSPGYMHPNGAFSPKAPLLQLMAAVTPDRETEDSIKYNFDYWMNELVITDDSPNRLDSDGPETVYILGLPGALAPVKARLVYIQVPKQNEHGTELILVWRFVIEMKANSYEASVSAASPHCIISIGDRIMDAPIPVPDNPYTRPATYQVFPWGLNDPTEGERTIEKELFDPLVSPAGWHSLPVSKDPSTPQGLATRAGIVWRNTTTTWGNNVFAQEDWESSGEFLKHRRPDAGASKKFHYPYDPKVTDEDHHVDEVRKHVDFTISQVFYTVNVVHDIFYRYGFDEVAGNFQQHNFDLGGKDKDAVIADVQLGDDFGNANFFAGVDGENGIMRMWVFNTAIPYRDAALDAGIVIHELGHGLSTRITGGPSRDDCLQHGEAQGMGEGWSDFLATHFRAAEGVTEYPVGAWAQNQPVGVRKHRYSLDTTVNPTTYETLNNEDFDTEHDIGEVWAEMLWVVSQRLIIKHGFSANKYPPAPPTDGTVGDGSWYRKVGGVEGVFPKHGNTLSIQLVINALKLQPCFPSFFTAREAILRADWDLTGGENICEIWGGFAARGLGVDARYDTKTKKRTNGFAVPGMCKMGDEHEQYATMKEMYLKLKPQCGRVGSWLMGIVGWGF